MHQRLQVQCLQRPAPGRLGDQCLQCHHQGADAGTATTNATGYWQVCGLVPGNYWANETLKSGWQNANPSQLITLLCVNKTDVNFRNTPELCISGYKYNACNGLPLQGWEIKVFNASTKALMGTATTNGTGYWQVCDLVPGNYWANETLKSGWQNANPNQIVVLLCVNKTDVNFRNTPKLCISGYKYNACTGLPLQGWEIKVFNASTKALMGTATTNGTGYWQVCDLVPGNYWANETLKSGWQNANPNQLVALVCVNKTDVNFRNTPKLCISGYKYNACTGLPLQGWEIKVFNASTKALMGTATTNVTGYWQVCGLVPGNYWANETLKGGWQNANSNQLVALLCVNKTNVNFRNTPKLCISGYKYNKCSNQPIGGWVVNVYNATTKALAGTATTNATGYWQVCGLAPGNYWANETLKDGWQTTTANQTVALGCDNRTGVDFYNTPLLCISGTKVNDCNEQGLDGWTVILKDSNGKELARNTTVGVGQWSFCDLLPGNYYVEEELRSGWRNVTSLNQSVTLGCNNAVGVVFRNSPLLCISGYKQNERGDGLSGWTIEARNSSGVVGTTLTDSTGRWEICQLEPGTYDVSEVLQSNYKALTPVTVTVDLSRCNNKSNINFTNTRPACIEGFKLDEKGQGLAGWTIEARNSTGAIAGTAHTDQSGFWQICGLLNGTYTVCERLDEHLGWVNLTPVCRDVLMKGENITDLNFTNTDTHCISGRKTDSITGEGLSGWTITATGQDSFNQNIQASNVTNATGYWKICGLLKGNYTVCEKLKPGWTQTGPNTPDGCYHINVDGQNSFGNLDFSNDPRNLCLSGHKFHNVTGEGLSGWTIIVSNTTDSVTAMTNETGYWQVCGLASDDYEVCEVLQPGWTQASPKGCYNETIVDKNISDLDFYNDAECSLILTKTADKPEAHRGEDITYTIDLSNPCPGGLCFTNVTLWDVLPQGVELVSVSPAPSSGNLTWFVGRLCPKDHFAVTIVVRIPIVDINYDMAQGVQGAGFVNVHNDYDTHQGPESITNCAYAKADLVETLSCCASTSIIDPGTELKRREFGSGIYESEELTRIRTENKSIKTVTSLSAVHQPTTFSLPQGRSMDYGTKWTEKSKGINTITGATMNEEYTHANNIDKDRSIETRQERHNHEDRGGIRGHRAYRRSEEGEHRILIRKSGPSMKPARTMWANSMSTRWSMSTAAACSLINL